MQNAAGPYLGDTLAMTTAFLKLYEATGDRAWIARAIDGAHFIASTFRDPKSAGYVSASGERPERDENILLARTANLLHQYTGDASFREIAEQAMRYAASPAIARQYAAAGLLLADRELTVSPL